jgi:enterochelin esterase-like enzyme
MPSPFPNAPHHIRGTQHCYTHHSTVLKNNFWNDPHIRDLWVHLPHDYDPQKSYPLLIVLPAFAGTAEGLLARSLTDVSLTHRIDRWIAEGTCPPFIAMFPDCMSQLGGTQFLDSPAIGNYAQYITKEIIPFVQKKHRTSNIAIMGHSSGGYGALRLAMEHPSLFSAVACHAGDMGFSSAYSADLLPALFAIHQAGGPKPFLSSFWKKRHFAPSEFSAFNMLCMAAAYSPDLNQYDFPAKLPFDYNEGTIDFTLFQSWEEHDPLTLIHNKQHQESLKRLNLLYIECGRQDEYLLQFGARRFTRLLTEYDVSHTYEEFEGGHRGGSLRFSHSIPQLIHTCL